ncbi:putative non-specific lipid-transfer protein AKCS9 [Cardamine amara subsp. amara]|uniref:Non-specific lipid-transfer protein AKCS9 n=1 Tax=Cardamine amara subsp. amara TaxID=228776 RepID=A0ABD1C9E8_CARAN
MKFTTPMFITFVIVAMSSLSPARATEADCFAECFIFDLITCFPAMTFGGDPCKECCAKLVEQKSCLCSYIQDPMLSIFSTSPNAAKVLAACKVPVPTCS